MKQFRDRRRNVSPNFIGRPSSIQLVGIHVAIGIGMHDILLTPELYIPTEHFTMSEPLNPSTDEL